MLRRSIAVLLAAFSAALLLVSTAHAGIVTSLGSGGFGEMVVDDAHSHVFISRPSANAVEVYDFRGNLVQTIGGQNAPLGMVLNGSTLYVAESTVGTIEKIDTQVLSDTGALASGLPHLSRLAFAGGRLWTAVNGQLPYGSATLASVTTSGTVASFDSYYAPDFGTSPGAPNTLYVVTDGLSPGSMYQLDVSGPAPTVVANRTIGSNPEQVAVSSDGSKIMAVTGSPYEFDELSASSLAYDGVVYPGAPYPSAAAFSPGHQGLIATGLQSGYSSPDIRVHAIGNPVPLFTASTNGPDGTANVPPRGLAMSADGELLFAVTGSSSYSLSVLRIFGQTTTSLTSSLNPSLPGQQVTFNVSVSPNSAPTTPTGTVELTDGGTHLASLTLTNGTASYSTSAFAWGTHPITATYSGDGNYDGSSAQLSQTVNPFHASTSVTTSATPVTTGQPVTFTASVTPDPGAPTPTGTVRFDDSLGGTLGTRTIGVDPLTLSTSFSTGGVHTIYAVYSGDNAFSWSSGSVSEAVLPFPTQTTVIPSVNPSVFGQSVTVSASVSPTASGGTPTGTVAFFDGQTAFDTEPLTNGKAAVTTSALAVGNHLVTATYSGDSTFKASTSSFVQTVSPPPKVPDANGTFIPLPPTRILDTRTTHSPVGPNKTIDVQAAGVGAVPASGVTAVVVNLTATEPSASSYLTAYPTGSAPPLASNLNVEPGQTVANLVVVKLGTGGKFSVYNAQGYTHVIADVVGWYSDGSAVTGDRYTPLPPSRILDTRSMHSPIGTNKSIDVQAAGVGGVPATGVTAVVVNLTATDPTAGSYLTAYPTGGVAPLASNLNFGPGQTIPNLAVVKLDTNGKFSIYNAQGTTDVVVDVVGWYSNDPSLTTTVFTPLSPARILDTRTTNSAVGPNRSIDVQATGAGGVPASGVTAVVVNITATEPTAGSYLTAYPTGGAVPLASNLNFGPGQTIPNLVVVKLGTGGKFSVYNAQGYTHVIADVVGWY